MWQGDGIGDKGFQLLRLAHPGSSVDLLVVHTHLQSQYRPASLFHYSGVRRAQLDQILEAAHREGDALPVLAAGDFNTRPDEDIYREISRSWKDLTTRKRVACQCGTQAKEPGRTRDWIDYLLARPSREWDVSLRSLDLVRSEAPDDPYSDHHGLDAQLVLLPRESAALSPKHLALAQLAAPCTRRHWLACLGILALEGSLGSVASSTAPTRRR